MLKILKGFLLLATLATVCTRVYAQQQASSHQSHQPNSLVGIHGMALMKAGDKLIASHMPLHNSIHAFQLVFEVEVSSQHQQRLNALLAAQPLVSLMPEKFDLRSMFDGQLKSFEATIFNGHFERGGEPVGMPVNFIVSEMLLAEPLRTADNGDFYWVGLSDTERLAIHQIANQPSYDQLFYLQFAEAPTKQIKLLTTGAVKPLSAEQFAAELGDIGLAKIKPLYLETRDFQ